MPIIFQNRIGAVVQLADPGIQCRVQLLGLPDAGITYELERSIVTRVTYNQQVNVQFLHTLGSLIYVYVFGDRIGQVTLSGLSFACECPGGVDLGAEKMLSWYQQNRASRRKAPIRVMIGNYTITGFVIGVTEDVVDPSTSLVQWGINLNALPDDPGAAAGPLMPVIT